MNVQDKIKRIQDVMKGEDGKDKVGLFQPKDPKELANLISSGADGVTSGKKANKGEQKRENKELEYEQFDDLPDDLDTDVTKKEDEGGEGEGKDGKGDGKDGKDGKGDGKDGKKDPNGGEGEGKDGKGDGKDGKDGKGKGEKKGDGKDGKKDPNGGDDDDEDKPQVLKVGMVVWHKKRKLFIRVTRVNGDGTYDFVDVEGQELEDLLNARPELRSYYL